MGWGGIFRFKIVLFSNSSNVLRSIGFMLSQWLKSAFQVTRQRNEERLLCFFSHRPPNIHHNHERFKLVSITMKQEKRQQWFTFDGGGSQIRAAPVYCCFLLSNNAGKTVSQYTSLICFVLPSTAATINIECLRNGCVFIFVGQSPIQRT